MVGKLFLTTCCLIVVSAMTWTTSHRVTAQTPQDESRDADARLRQALYRSKANALSIVIADGSSEKFAVCDDPVMTWSGLGGWSGDVFVWTGKGRIQVVGCIGSQQVGDSLRVFQEFHSLADEQTEALELAPSVSWQIPYQANRPRELRGAPQPAPTASRRLVQMRSLARRFSVGMQVTDDNVESSLRLLPSPLARETSRSEDVVDSALFTFVSSSGTDPEAFLLLEARRIDGELKWVYMPARFTTRELWMSLDGNEIWRVAAVDQWDPQPRIESAYFYRDESTITIDAIAN